MDPEDLIYRALDRQQTKRVPTLSILADPNIVNQVLGRTRPNPILEFVNSPRGQRLVDRYGEPASRRLFNVAMFFWCDLVTRVNYMMGFDGVLLMYWRGKIVDHETLEDVFGRRFDVVDDGFGNAYMMYREGLLQTPDDWRAYRRPGIAAYARGQGILYRLLRRRWRGRIATVPFVGPGLWENSWQPMGFERFVVMMRRDPAFVREVVGYFTALTVAAVDAYCRAGARILAYGDDLAYRSGPMLSVDMLEKFYGDGYRQIAATAHRYGARVMIHCCGNSYELLDKFVEWGFDGAHAFEPTAGITLGAAREKIGDKLCLVGNIDITRTLVDAPREEVEAEVARAISEAAGGGFILAPAHTHAAISVERVRWMLEAARR